jgi:hypothetical protein
MCKSMGNNNIFLPMMTWTFSNAAAAAHLDDIID